MRKREKKKENKRIDLYIWESPRYLASFGDD
jgi:hypothetical protein